MRTVIAGVAAGLVMFLWGMLAHTALPLGKAGMRFAPQAAQYVALAALRGSFDAEGIYLLPLPAETLWEDEAAMAAFGADAATRPYAFVVFQPQGHDVNAAFGPMLARQLGICVLGGVLAAGLTAGLAGRRARHALHVAGLGVFAWLVVVAPYWNWYRFPAEFVLAALVEQAVGWLLAGLVIAWLARPKTA